MPKSKKKPEQETIPLTLTAFALAPVGDRDWQPVRIEIAEGRLVNVEPIGLGSYPYMAPAYIRLAGDVLDYGQENQIDPRKVAQGVPEGDTADAG